MTWYLKKNCKVETKFYIGAHFTYDNLKIGLGFGLTIKYGLQHISINGIVKKSVLLNMANTDCFKSKVNWAFECFEQWIVAWGNNCFANINRVTNTAKNSAKHSNKYCQPGTRSPTALWKPPWMPRQSRQLSPPTNSYTGKNTELRMCVQIQF